MASKQLTLDQIDPNFAIENNIDTSDICFYDVRQKPFSIYGLYRPYDEPVFKRMPDDVAAQVSSGVQTLALNTAGGRVRFATDSPYIVIHAVMKSSGIQHFSHMPLTGGAGFDLYLDDPQTGTSHYQKTFIPPQGQTEGYTSKVLLTGKGRRCYTIHFPNYNNVDALYVGLQRGAVLDEGMPYPAIDPIVFYGSSITQGGCASRPGNAYAAVLCRRLNRDFINLGFSGSGKGEDAMVDYMAGLSMSMFVCDYDHNAPNTEHLKRTHRKLYERIRASHPSIPFIILSKPDFYTSGNPQNNAARRSVIYDTYRYAQESGDRNVYFIDGAGLFCGPYEDMCTVDGTHPNDLGFALMADKIEQTVRRTFKNRYQ